METQTLFALPGEMGLRYDLYYRSVRPYTYAPFETDTFGYGLDLLCDDQGDVHLCRHVIYARPDGSSIKFSGNPADYGNFPEIGGANLATLTHNTDGTWVLHDEDAKTVTWLEDQYSDTTLTSVKDASGIGWTLSNSNGVTTITHTNGQRMTIQTSGPYGMAPNQTWNVSITDPAGNVYAIVEDVRGMPQSVTLPGSPQTVTTYKYDTSGIRLTEVDYNGVPYSITTYDTNNRANGTHMADGSQATAISYAYPPTGGMTATIINPLGHTTTNTYNSDHLGGGYLLASVSENAVSDCGATVHSRAYDVNDNLQQTVDNNGITHTYAYAANGQLQTETEASGTSIARKTDYVWDPNQQLNRLLSVTVEGETRTNYTYNAQNRLASVTHTNLTAIGTPNQALTTSYAYTLYGNGMVASMVVTTSSPGGTAKVTTAYDTLGNITSVTDGLGHATTYTSYNGLGEPGHVIGANGDVTDYSYDARGRVVTKTTHPNGTTASWSYAYDGFGLLNKLTAPGNEVTTWTRNPYMQVTSVSHNDKDGTSTETFGYDANGDVTSDVIARGSDIGKSSTVVYDALGRVYQRKGNHGQVLTYAYDGNGNVLSVTDALNHKTSYQYDALNRLIKTTDAVGGVTQYAYDAGDHLTRVTDPRGLVTTYSYDGLGLLWKQVSPDTGTTSFSYDAYARLASKTRADGVQSVYSYDVLNRPTRITASGKTQTFTYDTCTNGKGRLCSAADAATTTSYSYTPEGWIAGRGFTVSGNTYALGYSYDTAGRLAVVNYPDGNQALYDYVQGQVQDIRAKVGTTTFCCAVDNVKYRPMGLATSSWISHGGLTNTLTYDTDMRPTSMVVPGVELMDYSYDAADRLTYLNDASFAPAMKQGLAYDALNRLYSVRSSADNEDLRYDADGNQTLRIRNGVTTTSYYGASNRLDHSYTGSNPAVGYHYDAQGNLTASNGGPSFAYDAFDRMSTASSTSYEVNPQGQRLRKSNGGGTVYFAPDTGGAQLADDDNGIWSDYVYLNGRPVGMIRGGVLYAIHTTPLGRVQAVTRPDTYTVWVAENYAYDRKVITDLLVGGMHLGLPGQYLDDETGLWNNGARDYDSSLGRYIESDPIGLLGGINSYAYVGNNPISNVDLLGMAPGDIYQSIRAAGIAAVTDVNSQSIRTNTEYGGLIYASWFGGYSYTAPHSGTSDSVDAHSFLANYSAWFHTVVADYHTHAAFDPSYDNEDFSPQDTDIDGNAGIYGFLGTPSGAILMYAPFTYAQIVLKQGGNCP